MELPEDDPDRHWTEAGVYRVADGVYRTPLPLPDALRAVNVYIVVDGDGFTLIDSGWAMPQTRERLERALGHLDAGLGDVRQFLITHVHRDHYTQAAELRRAHGMTISLGVGEKESLAVIADPDLPAYSAQLAHLRECGAESVADRLAAIATEQRPDPAMWEGPDRWLQPEECVPLASRTLRAVETPGHTRGHMVFFDSAAGLLFAGDHVLPHITPSISFEPAPPPLPLNSYLGALRRVRALPDARLLPAHGPAHGTVHARVDELLFHHDQRLAEVLQAVERGGTTAYAVAQLLTWTRREMSFGLLEPFHQMLAVIETAAHLDLLVSQSQLTDSVQAGVRSYAPARVEGMQIT